MPEARKDRPPLLTAERVLLAEGGVYALVEVAQQGMTMLLLPAFFFFLTVEDFGVITTAVVVSQVTMFVSTMGLDFTLLRQYYVWTDDERPRLVSGVLYLATAWSVAVGACVSVATVRLFGSVDYRLALVLGAWAGFALGLRNIPLSVVRVKGEMKTYASAELGAAIGRGLSQLALIALGFGAAGYMTGYLLGPLLSAAVLLYSARSGFRWRHPRWRLTSQVWSYTWHVLPSLVFNRLFAIVDRLILFKWADFDSLGIYGAASRFSTSLKLLTGGFKLAIAPALSRAENGDADSASLYASLSRLLLLTMLSVGSALMVCVWFVQFTPWAGRWVEVERLVSVLLLAQFLGGFGLIWQMGFYYSSTPQAVSIANTVSAVALVAALLALVPSGGAMGAALAQAIAAAANLAALAALEAKMKGHIKSWHEMLGLTALFLPAIAGIWLIDARHQLYVLLPTFLFYGAITASSIRRFWQPAMARL